jgi:hypothetical protein
MSYVWSKEPAKDEEELKRKWIDAKGRGLLFAAVKITSDPPGAEVYDDRGNCWGQTGERDDGYVYRVYRIRSSDLSRGVDTRTSITLRKRGFDEAKHAFSPGPWHSSEWDALQDCQEFKIVLLGGPLPPQEVVKEKETIQREVIVKIRCRHCGQTFEETLNRCPNCGAPA